MLGTDYLRERGIQIDTERSGQHTHTVNEALQAYAAAYEKRIFVFIYVAQELSEYLRQKGFREVRLRGGHELRFDVDATSPDGGNLLSTVQEFLRNRYPATGMTGCPPDAATDPSKKSCTVSWFDTVSNEPPQTTTIQ